MAEAGRWPRRFWEHEAMAREGEVRSRVRSRCADLLCRIAVGASTVVVTVVLASVTAIEPAWAGNTACGPQDNVYFAYAGQYTLANNFKGIEAGVNVDGMYLPVGYQNSHLLTYLAMLTSDSGCSDAYQSNCQIQGGYGTGYLGYPGINIQMSNEQLYVEKNDAYGYTPLNYPSFTIGLALYLKDYASGTSYYDPDLREYVYEYDVTVDNHSGGGAQNFGKAYMPQNSGGTAFAQSEGLNHIHGYCPVLSQYQYFGYAQGFSNQFVQLSFDGANYGWWTNSWTPGFHTTQPPYSTTYLGTGSYVYSEFASSGG